jgi:hypothetical protein
MNRESAATKNDIDSTLAVRLAPDCTLPLPQSFPKDELGQRIEHVDLIRFGYSSENGQGGARLWNQGGGIERIWQQG